MPLSWPDGHYGIGPFSLCNRAGREARPRLDYRSLRLRLGARGPAMEFAPDRDARGCPDADDALYTEQFLDQVLNEESRTAEAPVLRPQPSMTWTNDVPIIEAVGR